LSAKLFLFVETFDKTMESLHWLLTFFLQFPYKKQNWTPHLWSMTCIRKVQSWSQIFLLVLDWNPIPSALLFVPELFLFIRLQWICIYKNINQFFFLLFWLVCQAQNVWAREYFPGDWCLHWNLKVCQNILFPTNHKNIIK